MQNYTQFFILTKALVNIKHVFLRLLQYSPDCSLVLVNDMHC